MDDIKAAEILKSLAAGMDPAVGQPLTSIAPLQSPDVVRALFLAADSLEMRLRQSRRQSTLPRNAANRGRRTRTSACWPDSTLVPGSKNSPRRTSARVQASRRGW
jgi:hypothetical protein